ncbi:MAG: hypothetical protein R3B52_01860 [Candidatus Paceibacterota bacterium]
MVQALEPQAWRTLSGPDLSDTARYSLYDHLLRDAGAVASIALVVYIILLLAIFKLFFTLTLAGISWYLALNQVAVDTNILILSRPRS